MLLCCQRTSQVLFIFAKFSRNTCRQTCELETSNCVFPMAHSVLSAGSKAAKRVVPPKKRNAHWKRWRPTPPGQPRRVRSKSHVCQGPLQWPQFLTTCSAQVPTPRAARRIKIGLARRSGTRASSRISHLRQLSADPAPGGVGGVGRHAVIEMLGRARRRRRT